MTLSRILRVKTLKLSQLSPWPSRTALVGVSLLCGSSFQAVTYRMAFPLAALGQNAAILPAGALPLIPRKYIFTGGPLSAAELLPLSYLVLTISAPDLQGLNTFQQQSGLETKCLPWSGRVLSLGSHLPCTATQAIWRPGCTGAPVTWQPVFCALKRRLSQWPLASVPLESRKPLLFAHP